MACYGVKVGKVPGVYNTWDECKTHVVGFTGAEYKKFQRIKDAKMFVFGTHKCENNHKELLNEVHLYTNSICIGNPGPGSYSYVVVIDDVILLKGSGGLPSTTNIHMEITAVIEGLRVLPDNYSVVIHTYSVYLANAFNNYKFVNYKNSCCQKNDTSPVAGRELWESFLCLVSAHKSVSFVCIKEHSEKKFHKICSYLANSTAKNLKFDMPQWRNWQTPGT